MMATFFFVRYFAFFIYKLNSVLIQATLIGTEMYFVFYDTNGFVYVYLLHQGVELISQPFSSIASSRKMDLNETKKYV